MLNIELKNENIKSLNIVDLLNDDKVLVSIPTKLRERTNNLVETTQISQYRLLAEALLIGLEELESKYHAS